MYKCSVFALLLESSWPQLQNFMKTLHEKKEVKVFSLFIYGQALYFQVFPGLVLYSSLIGSRTKALATKQRTSEKEKDAT